MKSFKPDYPIGANIAELRKSCGLTQDQMVAKFEVWRIPVSKSRYAKIETDRINLRLRELAALKRIFHCSYADFFKGIDEILDNEIKVLFDSDA